MFRSSARTTTRRCPTKAHRCSRSAIPLHLRPRARITTIVGSRCRRISVRSNRTGFESSGRPPWSRRPRFQRSSQGSAASRSTGSLQRHRRRPEPRSACAGPSPSSIPQLEPRIPILNHAPELRRVVPVSAARTAFRTQNPGVALLPLVRNERVLSSRRVSIALVIALGAVALRSFAQTAELVRPPAVEKKVDATFPTQGLGTRHQVKVVVRVTVATDGTVVHPEIVESGGPAL